MTISVPASGVLFPVFPLFVKTGRRRGRRGAWRLRRPNSAVSHRVGAEMARVAGSARYLSAYQGPGRLPTSPHGLSTRVAAAEAARAGIAPAEGVFGAAAGAGALLGKALPAAIGVGSVVAASKAAISSFAELEAKVTSLGITAEATDAEVKAAMETFRQLGPQYGVSAAQVSEAAEKYVAAGIDFKQAVEGTPAAIKAAKASGADLSDIVDAGVASMQNLDIEAGGLDRAFDVMARAASSAPSSSRTWRASCRRSPRAPRRWASSARKG